jgi:hypothetical protein
MGQVLSLVQKLLNEKTPHCHLVKASKEVPFDRLIVFLGTDTKKRERLLEIVESQPHLSEELTLPDFTALFQRLQFRVQLPFQVQDFTLSQMTSLLLFINRFLDLPGFELDELEGKVSYRYVWLTQTQTIDSSLLDHLVGMISLNLALFTEIIESIAEGKISFNDLLAQISKNQGPFASN